MFYLWFLQLLVFLLAWLRLFIFMDHDTLDVVLGYCRLNTIILIILLHLNLQRDGVIVAFGAISVLVVTPKQIGCDGGCSKSEQQQEPQA